jgi:hypothetical protein
MIEARGTSWLDASADSAGRTSGPVAVTGMHRSGTSMVARILAVCGLYLGEPDQLVPATATNPEGHFEHIDFLRVNKAVLAKLLGSWKTPPRRWAWRVLGWRLAGLRDEASLLVRSMEPHAPWGWKDPRTSLTLPFWLPLIPNLRLLACVRDPLAVAGSLEARDGLATSFSLRLWHAHYRELFRTAQGRIVVTRYEAYFEEPQREILRVVERLKLPALSQSVEAAAATVRPDLRQHGPTDQTPLPPAISRSHSELLELASS